MMTAGHLKKWHTRVDTLAGNLSAIIILLLVIATAVDSIGRSVFNHPFVGVFEISEFAMAWIGFLAVAYTQLQRGHITMNLIKGFLPPRVQATLDFIIMVISFMIVLFLGWVGLSDALESIEFGDMLTSGLITIPVGPPKLIIPFGCLLLALRFISQMVDDLLLLFGTVTKGQAESNEVKFEGETGI
jgi:TRAP-type C4-dicarboxylate transport system permease small subunit